METADRLLPAAQAAEVLGVGVSTIRRLTQARELPHVRPTGRRTVRFRQSDLHQLLRERFVPARVRVPV